MVSFSYQLRRSGRRLLEDLLPQARQRALKMEVKSRSGLMEAVRPYMKEGNIDTVIVHQTANGGWFADLILKKVPLGVSNAMGTPVGSPHATREGAMENAITLIACCLVEYEAPPVDPMPSFDYYDVEIKLSRDALDILEKGGTKYPSTIFALVQLKETTDALFPDGFNFDRLRSLSNEDRATLFNVLHMATTRGIMRFPENEMGDPIDDAVRQDLLNKR